MKAWKAKWVGGESAQSNASRELPKLVKLYFESGRRSVKKKVTPEELHKFRLLTKELRYLLEVFLPFYPARRIDGFLKRLRQLQTMLGDWHDCNAADELISGIPSKHTEKLSKHLKKLSDQQLSAFRKYWKDEFDTKGELEKWKEFLEAARPVPRSPKET